LCKETQVQNSLQGNKKQGRGITPLGGQERMIVDQSIDQSGRSLRGRKEVKEEVAKRSSTPLSGASLEEEVPTRPGRSTSSIAACEHCLLPTEDVTYHIHRRGL